MGTVINLISGKCQPTCQPHITDTAAAVVETMLKGHKQNSDMQTLINKEHKNNFPNNFQIITTKLLGWRGLNTVLTLSRPRGSHIDE